MGWGYVLGTAAPTPYISVSLDRAVTPVHHTIAQ